MTNSNNSCEVTAIIDEIFELLDADYIHQTIDGPMEEAVESFEFDSKAPMTFQSFFQNYRRFYCPSLPFWPGCQENIIGNPGTVRSPVHYREVLPPLFRRHQIRYCLSRRHRQRNNWN